MNENNKISYWKNNTSWDRKHDDPLKKEELFVLNKWLMSDKKINSKKILEAGCATGRIVFNLEKLIDSEIIAFDYVDKFIDIANEVKKEKQSKVSFFTGDSMNLDTINDDSFDYVLHLNGFLSFFDEASRSQVVNETRRVLKKDGIYILKVLDFDERAYNKILNLFLGLCRKLRGEAVLPRMMPRLKVEGGSWDFGFWKKDRELLYWFYREEIIKLLSSFGFRVLETVSAQEISGKEKEEIGIFILCQK